jgi:hypothetical protein
MIWILLLNNAFALDIVTWDFEDSENGFSTDGIQWEWGGIKGAAIADATGERCWATQTTGHYLNDATGYLFLPSVDLRVTARPVLTLHHWFDIDSGGEGDHGRVEAHADGSWYPIEPIYGYVEGDSFSFNSDGWRTDYFDLTGVETSNDLRISFEADETVSRWGWLIDHISIQSGDAAPPLFTNVSALDDTWDVETAYPLSAQVIDDIGVTHTELFWTLNGGDVQSIVLIEETDDWYTTTIPNQLPDSVIEWWLLASDGVNTTRWPASTNESFRVFLPAPSNVQAPDALSEGRISATSTQITWSAPEEIYPIIGYDLYLNEVPILSTPATEANVPLLNGWLDVTVQATFDTEEGAYAGDLSSPLSLQVLMPFADAIDPAEGWPGDRVRMNITGENLLLEEADTVIDAGDGITVESIDIVDANHARVMMHIDDDAPIGAREITLSRGGTPIEVEPIFSVLSDGIRPQVSDVHPNTIQQGVRATIHIDFSMDLSLGGDLPLVDFGEGIYTEDVNRRGNGLDVSISVASDAPLGAHSVEVDTGTRLLSGAQLLVKDDSKPTGTNCSTTQNKTGTLWFLLATLVALSRRSRRSGGQDGRDFTDTK